MSTESTRPDVNYISIAGNQAFLGTRDFSRVDGSLYATVLKASDGVHDQTLTNLKVPNGHETSIDCDWSTNMRFEGDFGLGPQLGDNVLRGKGGFKNLAYAGTLHSRGQRHGCDIELGDWFDQNPAISRGCDLTGILPHADGQGPNRVAIGWVMPFTTKLGPNCKRLFWLSLGLKVYVLVKFVIRFFLRIPRGTKGPSWF